MQLRAEHALRRSDHNQCLEHQKRARGKTYKKGRKNTKEKEENKREEKGEEIKKRRSTPEGKEYTKLASKKRWADPVQKAKAQETRKNWANTKEGRKKLRAAGKKFYHANKARLRVDKRKSDFKRYQNEEKHFFHNEDYKVFFKKFEKKNEKINFYYYDGEHSYKNQLENLEIADNFLDKGSIVLIDDINFPEVENGTKDFLNKTKSTFKVHKEIKTANNHCHPSFWNGILILEKI